MSPLIWANLLHLSTNLWTDTPPNYSDELRLDDGLWSEITQAMAEAGFTMAVIDLGDGVEYSSHPEIAVRGAWSVSRLRDELARLRELGLEPIPKLNFSTCHDAWLKDYSRQVSTPAYYQVAADLIAESFELFGQPRFLHIGMDEETAPHQHDQQLVVIRQHELWWHDVEFFAEEVAKNGARPWMWSDHAWRIPAEYYTRMPQSILQSNWYYMDSFDADDADRPRVIDGTDRCLAYLDLDDHGYDQVPTGSIWADHDNFAKTVDYCSARVDPERLLGFLQTPWLKTIEEHRAEHFLAIDVVRQAKAKFESSTQAASA